MATERTIDEVDVQILKILQENARTTQSEIAKQVALAPSAVMERIRKLEAKNCDMVVANLVNQTGTGFESDRNKVTLVLRTGEVIDIPEESKRKVADAIFDQALKMRLALHAAQ